MTSLGIGNTASALMVAPLVLLFDYTKTHKNKTMDLIIPAAGVALVALVYIEGFFQVLTNLQNIIAVGA